MMLKPTQRMYYDALKTHKSVFVFRNKGMIYRFVFPEYFLLNAENKLKITMECFVRKFLYKSKINVERLSLSYASDIMLRRSTRF